MINSTAVIAADYKVYGSVRLTSLNGPGMERSLGRQHILSTLNLNLCIENALNMVSPI